MGAHIISPLPPARLVRALGERSPCHAFLTRIAVSTMARFPFFWGSPTTGLVSSLALIRAIIPWVRADSAPATIIGTNAAGVEQVLLVDRYPALYTGDFGDCMGGQSLINITSFDAAYYADNLTVLFDLAGTTNLRSEAVICAYLPY